MNNKKSLISFFAVLILSLTMAVTSISANNLTEVPGMLGKKAPEGTIASSDSVYSNFVAQNAVDGDINTRWNARGAKAYLELQFPTAEKINFVQFATNATPAVVVNYTIFGSVKGEWNQISPSTSLRLSGTNSINPPILINEGVYEGIKIQVNGGSSWAAINELTFGFIEAINLKANPGDSNVKLSWNHIENSESYIIKYGTEPGKYTESISVSKDDYTGYTIPNLINGTKYYFQVVSVVKGKEFIDSNEAEATTNTNDGGSTPDKPNENDGSTNPSVPDVEDDNTNDPDEDLSDRAILVVTMTTGLEKEFDLSMKEVNSFIEWYENKQVGNGKAAYAIDKHENNKGPFKSRKDYILYDRVLTFEVNEY
ncbi:discoidin domain-containing protein [Paenibacillus illinoisensis]|uniref:discoidin domain-containing protein n=1 Tax=Paenibacillus illinoisensis TaxID=59845 RepID=UPI00203C7427|nr:discoidin domain-containing protein [Paenibacillus illinoisensis]MCM3206366.1 discoidin domain-containing protein [Paenibacillus illinoisensis]